MSLVIVPLFRENISLVTRLFHGGQDGGDVLQFLLGLLDLHGGASGLVLSHVGLGESLRTTLVD